MSLALAVGVLDALAGSAAAQPMPGSRAFARCAACHSVKPGENGVGPSLSGILGAKAGQVEGFRFSSAMKRSGVVWTPATLDQFIANPQDVVPGTRMPFEGISDAKERAQLLDYLQKLQ